MDASRTWQQDCGSFRNFTSRFVGRRHRAHTKYPMPLVTLSSLWQQDSDHLLAETSQSSGRDVSRLARLRPTGCASLHVTQRPGVSHFAPCQNLGFARQNAIRLVHSDSAEVLPASPPARTVACYHRFSPRRRSPHTRRVGLGPAPQVANPLSGRRPHIAIMTKHEESVSL